MDLVDGATSVDMAEEEDEAGVDSTTGAVDDSTIGAVDGSTTGAGACRAVSGGEARRHPNGKGIGGAVLVVGVEVEGEAEGVEGGRLNAILQAVCRSLIK